MNATEQQRQVMRELGRMGGLARAARLTPEQRIAQSRKAGLASARARAKR